MTEKCCYNSEWRHFNQHKH